MERLANQFKKSLPQLQSPFIATRPNVGVEVDVMINKLSTFVINTVKTSVVNVNLSRDQLTGYKSLKARTYLQIMKSDKSGDFVVSNIDAYKGITINHIKSNDEVYKWIPPTQKKQRVPVEVKCPTETTYINQLENKRSQIESECNRVWSDICIRRDIGSKFANLFHSTNTTLPVLYTLTKTHKIPVDVDISTLKITDIKVRPIISCSGSPIEKLSILATKIITPLLKFLPSHLKSIHEHLEILKGMEPGELAGFKFYTADVTALFTNVNVETSINDVIEFASEYWDQINTYGLKLVDLHRMLETILSNSFFTFNRRLYKQVFGAFIGCSISPPVAIIRVHVLEKRSIYTDLHITTGIRQYYKRYVDDMSSLARNKEEAIRNCERISEEDQDNRIVWEVEFPDIGAYVPFLDTEVRIDDEGKVSSRYYCKPQNKGITLNAMSHHPTSTKEAVVNNYYNTATTVSSGPEEKEYSMSIVDKMLANNGYSKPSQVFKTRDQQSKKEVPKLATLTLPYTNERDSNCIRNFIKANKMPIRPIFTPGKTLAQTFCKSRPFDQKQCVKSNPDTCEVCPMISKGVGCSKRGVVYEITCNLCGEKYQGETDRPLNHRIKEHIRACRNPQSYHNNALGHHFLTVHPTCQVDISVSVLDIQRNTLKRKLSEALYIYRDKQLLNEKSELENIVKYV